MGVTNNQPALGGIIYGIRLRDEVEFRYVGLTTKSVGRRLHQHMRLASLNRKTPFYDWLRKQDDGDVLSIELSTVESLEGLGRAEIFWINSLRLEGHRLLNISKGGLGPTGVVWTEEMREAARIRSTGRKGLSRFGQDGPFFGKTHSIEQRDKWSKERKGTNSGVENPNFGKFGSDHPGFGRTMSFEARQQLSEMRKGPGNPNYGKNASPETRAKMSAVRKGRSMPSSRRSDHTRHHTNKGVEKAECNYCIEDSAARNRSSESES